jgi:hypothetical protein
MTMRRILVPALAIGAAGLLTWGATPTAGQATPSTTPSASPAAQAVAQYLTDQLKSELNLTEAQVPKVQALSLKNAMTLEKLLKQFETDTSASSDKALVRGIVSGMQNSEAELKRILTPTQWTLHRQHRAERLAMNQTEVMAYTLDLTRSQILDVQRINQEHANKLVLALEQPKGAKQRTRQELLTTIQPTITARDSALARVLTAAQLAEMRENRRALHDLLVEQAATVAAAPAPPPVKK